MDRTIENKFVEPYRPFGVVSDCISYMRHHYDLGFSQQKKNLSEKWNNYYNTVLPKQIKERYDMCDNGGVSCFNSPLMNEIEANLCECKSDAEQKRYLYSLLTPFKEIVSVYNPIAEIKQIEGRIEEVNANRKIWKSCTNTDERAKAQVEACDSQVEREQGKIELYSRISNEFRCLTGEFSEGAKWMQEGTVEQCMSDFWCNAHRFGIRLYVLLLTYGIDYMAIQKECGIYLVNRVHIADIEGFVGTRELAQEYLNKLHVQSHPEEPAQSTSVPQLPEELNIPEVIAVLNKALKAGLIQQQGNYYKWIGDTKTKKELAYFIKQFNIKILKKPEFIDENRSRYGEEKFIISDFEELFNVSLISQEIQKPIRRAGYKKVDIFFNDL